jgi:glycosyltransferase involved in cell wall biosynthesis
MPPSITVVIPSYNGANRIPVLLNALVSQTLMPSQIVVVIDGSTDNTKEVVTKFQSHLPTLQIIHQQNGGRASAKNAGAWAATGELLIFFDDDMEPEPESVLKHVHFHQKQEGLLSGNAIGLEKDEYADIQNYKAFLSKKWIEKYQEGITKLTTSNLFFTAANCSMPKALFLDLTGFDSSLTDAEDYELAQRALEMNVGVFFDKTNVAFHHDAITCAGYIKRLREYTKAHQKVASLHTRDEPFKGNPLENFKRPLYALFSLALFPKLIDHFNVFIILPKKLRYWLYDLIIHSLSRVNPHIRLQ